MIAKMPTAETPNIEKTDFSRKVRLVFGLGLHSWEQLMLLSLGIAGLIAITVFVTTASVVILQRDENARTKDEFERYKVGVAAQVAEANAEIEKAKAETAQARTEQERLKAMLAWRTLPPNKAAKLIEALSKTPGTVNIRYTDGDPETIFFASQIIAAVRKGNWQIAVGSVKFSNALLFDIWIPGEATPQVKALRDAFREAELAFSTDDLPSGGQADFFVSTIPGAPMLVIGSKQPQLP